MSVFDAMARIKNYIENCPTNNMKKAAREDFFEAVNEVIKIGYTWGRQHQLPFEIDMLSKMPRRDLYKLSNMLKNGRNS
jgi:hypothetical protein